MNKKEFLDDLAYRLSYMDKIEKDDIINYYNELIEDGIETGKTESEVIADLGSIDNIIKRVDPNNKNKVSDDRIYYDEYDEKTNTEKKPENKKLSRNDKLVLGIVIAVVTFPLWFGLLMGLIGLLIGIVCGSIGIGVVGIACIFSGFVAMSGSFASGLFIAGAGFILMGLDVIIIPLIVKLIKWLIGLVIKFVKWLTGNLKKEEK